MIKSISNILCAAFVWSAISIPLAQAQCLDHQWDDEISDAIKTYPVKHVGSSGIINHTIISYASEKKNTDIANVIFLHGFADTMKNHKHLFNNFLNSNMRVLGFDYPEHGENSDKSINQWGLQGVAKIIASLLQDSAIKVNRSLPLILVGWSTGGTIALRIGQEWQQDLAKKLKPQNLEIAGIVAIAPAIGLPSDFFKSIGSAWTKVENRVLTNCDKGMQDPTPSMPLEAGLFAGDLLLQSAKLKSQKMNAKIPTLVFAAKKDDEFVVTEQTKQWITLKTSSNPDINTNTNPNLIGIECKNANHGMEFDSAPVGTAVRRTITEFAIQAAQAAKQKKGTTASQFVFSELKSACTKLK